MLCWGALSAQVFPGQSSGGASCHRYQASIRRTKSSSQFICAAITTTIAAALAKRFHSGTGVTARVGTDSAMTVGNSASDQPVGIARKCRLRRRDLLCARSDIRSRSASLLASSIMSMAISSARSSNASFSASSSRSTKVLPRSRRILARWQQQRRRRCLQRNGRYQMRATVCRPFAPSSGCGGPGPY
jgi:hypothetical protein